MGDTTRHRLGALALGLALAGTGAAQGQEADHAFDCVMDPSLKVNVGSQIPGLLEQVLVERGQTVRKGDVVARLVSEVEAAQVALDRIRAGNTAEIEAREAQLAFTRRQLDRTEDLVRHQAASVQHLDELRSQAEVSEREVRIARQAREVIRIEQTRSEATLRQREIRSPIDGLVTERVMTGGEYAFQEAVILRLARLDRLNVETFLPVKFYPRVAVGSEAVVEPAPPVGGRIAAKVTVVDHVFDAASGTFGVKLEVSNPDGKLPAGMRCKARFTFTE